MLISLPLHKTDPLLSTLLYKIIPLRNTLLARAKEFFEVTRSQVQQGHPGVIPFAGSTYPRNAVARFFAGGEECVTSSSV